MDHNLGNSWGPYNLQSPFLFLSLPQGSHTTPTRNFKGSYYESLMRAVWRLPASKVPGCRPYKGNAGVMLGSLLKGCSVLGSIQNIEPEKT